MEGDVGNNLSVSSQFVSIIRFDIIQVSLIQNEGHGAMGGSLVELLATYTFIFRSTSYVLATRTKTHPQGVIRSSVGFITFYTTGCGNTSCELKTIK